MCRFCCCQANFTALFHPVSSSSRRGQDSRSKYMMTFSSDSQLYTPSFWERALRFIRDYLSDVTWVIFWDLIKLHSGNSLWHPNMWNWWRAVLIFRLAWTECSATFIWYIQQLEKHSGSLDISTVHHFATSTLAVNSSPCIAEFMPVRMSWCHVNVVFYTSCVWNEASTIILFNGPWIILTGGIQV